MPLKQDDQNLFPDLLWNRPLNRRQAGRFLLLAGNIRSVHDAQMWLDALSDHGAGQVSLAFPMTISRLKADNVTLLPATPAGSLAQAAEPTLVGMTNESDGLVIGSNIGRHPQTVALVEKLAALDVPLVCDGTVIIESLHLGLKWLRRPHTLLVLNRDQLQKLLRAAKLPYTVTTRSTWQQTAEALERLSNEHQATFLITDEGQVWVTHSGEVSVSKKEVNNIFDLADTVVLWLQNQNKPFEAATAGLGPNLDGAHT